MDILNRIAALFKTKESPKFNCPDCSYTIAGETAKTHDCAVNEAKYVEEQSEICADQINDAFDEDAYFDRQIANWEDEGIARIEREIGADHTASK